MKSDSSKNIPKQLGKKIVELRQLSNMSQSDLSYEADIDISTLSRLERGVLNVTLSTLCKISDALKVDIKTLFDF